MAPACKNCGGPIGPRNRTGYCIKTDVCRSLGNGERRRDPTRPKQRSRLLAEARDLDTDEIIVDDVAITIAVSGTRVVSLTPTEREHVIVIMWEQGQSYAAIAHHIGVRPVTIERIVKESGCLASTIRSTPAARPATTRHDSKHAA